MNKYIFMILVIWNNYEKILSILFTHILAMRKSIRFSVIGLELVFSNCEYSFYFGLLSLYVTLVVPRTFRYIYITVFYSLFFAVMLHNSLKFLSERRVGRPKTCITQTYSLCACPQFGTCYLAFVVGSSLLYLCFVNCFIMNQSVSLLDGAFSYFSCRDHESRLYNMSFFSLLKVVQLTLIASF